MNLSVLILSCSEWMNLSMIQMTNDEIFYKAIALAEDNPLPLLRNGNLNDLELEIAYRQAQVECDDTPTLAMVHSSAIRMTLNLRKIITPYANMARLHERLLEVGFVFKDGRIHPPKGD